MIKTIDDLKALDADISSEFEKAIAEHLRFLLFESEFKNTAEICFMFMFSSDRLKNSIFDCAEKDDFYSMNVLYRSINEHYLRYEYFWFNNSLHKNDSYALLFRTSLDFNEKLAIENAINSAKKIKNQETKTSEEIWLKLVNSNKEFKKFTKGEIIEFSKKLSIKNIIHYLEKTFNNNGNEKVPFLQNSIIEYTILSSFVHGGFEANRQTVNFGVLEHKEKLYLNICKRTLEIATSIKTSSYLALFQFMPEFGELYNKTQELKRQIK